MTKIPKEVRWMGDIFLQNVSDVRVDNNGGYHDVIDYETIPGYLVIATVDHDDAPDLKIYTHGKIIKWYKEGRKFAKELVKDGKYDNLEDALVPAIYEVSPEDI